MYAPPATRLAGMRLDQLHFRIQHEQRGTSTCTQLNDLLRSIGDAAALIALLPRRVRPGSTASDAVLLPQAGARSTAEFTSGSTRPHRGENAPGRKARSKPSSPPYSAAPGSAMRLKQIRVTQ